MSGVVLRCPNCGTARATPGECAACHEAQVRYYCTNHAPGLWLDAPACRQCGARFGDPARAPVSAAPAAPAAPAVSRPKPPPIPPPRAPSAATRPSFRPLERPRAGGSPGSHRAPMPAAEEEIDSRDGRIVREAGWEEMLRAAGRVRPVPPEVAPASVILPVARGLGCLLRLALLAVFLFLALMAGLFMFGFSALRLF